MAEQQIKLIKGQITRMGFRRDGLGNAKDLAFDGCDWTDVDVSKLAEALPFARHVVAHIAELRALRGRLGPRCKSDRATAGQIDVVSLPRILCARMRTIRPLVFGSIANV